MGRSKSLRLTQRASNSSRPVHSGRRMSMPVQALAPMPFANGRFGRSATLQGASSQAAGAGGRQLETPSPDTRGGRGRKKLSRMHRRQEQVIFGAVEAVQSGSSVSSAGFKTAYSRHSVARYERLQQLGLDDVDLPAFMSAQQGFGADAPLSDSTVALLQRVLAQHPLLATLSNSELREVIDCMQRLEMDEGEAVASADDDGSSAAGSSVYMIVERGTLAVRGTRTVGEQMLSSLQYGAAAGGEQASTSPSGLAEEVAVEQRISAGESHGENALLGSHGLSLGAPDSYEHEPTIVALESHTVVWTLDAAAFRSTVASLSSWRMQQTREALRAVELLRPLSAAQLDTVAQVVRTEYHKPGDMLIRKGELGDRFYIVQLGTVVCTEGEGMGGEKVELSAGAYFGERALLSREDADARRGANVVAATDVQVLSLHRDAFTQLLGPLRSALALNMRLTALRSAGLFEEEHAGAEEGTAAGAAGATAPAAPDTVPEGSGEIFEAECRRFLAAMVAREVADGELIVQRGEPGESFVIVGRGQIEVVGESDADGSSTLHGAGAWLGKPSLLEPGFVWRHDVRAVGKGVEVHEVSRSTVHALRLKGLHHRLVLCDAELDAERARLRRKISLGLKSTRSMKAMMEDGDAAEALAAAAAPSEAAAEAGSLADRATTTTPAAAHPAVNSLDDLELLAVLGVGSFGTVRLVRHKGPDELYALKQLSKATVVLTRQQKNIRAERKVLHESDHPFILRLAATFSDDDSLYMLTELVQGGELFRRMHGDGTEENPLPLPDAQFYGACLTSVLAYIHERQIAYRDIKPENLLLDAAGYLKVVDWGFAKQVDGRTFTVCGTPEYLAPEAIKGTGHGTAVDCWALGVIIYEMLVGYSPFVGENYGDMMKISQSILKGEFTYPEQFPAEEDSHARDLIDRLLKTETERFGCLHKGMKDVQGHAFFKPLLGDCDSVAWERLARKELVAPWIPEIANAEDMSNFEAYEDEDIDPIEPFDGDNSAFGDF